MDLSDLSRVESVCALAKRIVHDTPWVKTASNEALTEGVVLLLLRHTAPERSCRHVRAPGPCLTQ